MSMSWKDAITQVIREHGAAMHYVDIASAITEKNLRDEVGATPAATVNSVISTDINNNGDRSLFIRVSPGEYILRELSQRQAAVPPEGAEITEGASEGILQAFGMFWRRDYVAWTANSKVLGQQQTGAKNVDFAEQIGVYLLHDDREVVYVGRAIDQPLAKRLFQHTYDRLNGRWNRFSWFGLSAVKEDGMLVPPTRLNVEPNILIATLEALLIEGLEPRQNRKRGDDFRAVEYIQIKDPKIRERQMGELVKRFEAMVADDREE